MVVVMVCKDCFVVEDGDMLIIFMGRVEKLMLFVVYVVGCGIEIDGIVFWLLFFVLILLVVV